MCGEGTSPGYGALGMAAHAVGKKLRKWDAHRCMCCSGKGDFYGQCETEARVEPGTPWAFSVNLRGVLWWEPLVGVFPQSASKHPSKCPKYPLENPVQIAGEVRGSTSRSVEPQQPNGRDDWAGF